MKELWRGIANVLATFGRRRMIYRPNPTTGIQENYLERFYILSAPLIGIYLHRFWADDEKILHNHPWSSISVILSGSYFEYMPENQNEPFGKVVMKIRKPLRPMLFFRKAEDSHYIILPKNIETWSLFIRFKRKRIWGFYRNGQWESAPVQSRREEMSSM